MQVGAEILKHLSQGIYSDPGNTLKELIINAYDACATKVIIRAKPDFDTITITDDGRGMNEQEFNEDFLIISRSRKRDEGDFSTCNRPIVGKFGIGFISALQICDEVELISKKEGEEFKLQAKIDFGKYKDIIAKKAKFQEISDVTYRNVPEKKDAHFTIIVMSKLSEDFLDILLDRDIKGVNLIDFSGMKFEKIISQIDKYIQNKELEDFTKAKGKRVVGRYWDMLFKIANTIPVEYLEDGPLIDSNRWPIIDQFKKETFNVDFDVDFDGIHLKKPIRFPNAPDITILNEDYDVFTFQEQFEFRDQSKLKFRGYIYNQKRSILPVQFRGLVIRIKNVAVGDFKPDFLDYPYSEKLFLPWTMGEVFVDEGLEGAMNIDRNTFNVTHPHYQKLRLYILDLLHGQVFPKARQRYTERMKYRKEQEKRDQIEHKLGIIERELGHDFSLIYDDDINPIQPIRVELENKRVTIFRFHPVFNKRKAQKVFLEDALLLIEIAIVQTNGNMEKFRQRFFDKIERW